eukprot:TRINITY_DN16560_c0_g1_i1.p2 TRINITY_DN16560_c0_g1~~TRINITY_DN16560_c0_g1_i1.p2  ORF type:complete len:101 (+),score=45.88 TRINITY_DN16560_c0_g1_i1:22-324(+)
MGIIVYLLSTAGGNLATAKQQQKIDDWITIKKLKVEKVDGCDADNKELRTKLWEVADKRGYPMLFIREGDSYEFIGDYDEIEYLMESEQFDARFASAEKE